MAGLFQLLELAKLVMNLSHPSPSQIMTVKLGDPSTSGIAFPDYEVREVYKNDGRELTGATGVVYHKNRLLIGSLFGDMLYCEVKFY